MRKVFLRLTIPDDWVKEISEKYTVSIKYIECVPIEDQGWRGVFEIKGREGELEKIVKDIENHPSVNIVRMNEIKKGVVFITVCSKKCDTYRILADSDCHLISGKSIGDGSVELKLITHNEGSLALLVRNLEKNGIAVELMNSNKLDKNALLTQRQPNIIQQAFENGYYDYPKKTTIKELSKLFDISPSTLGEILQRGEKKVIYEYFRNNF